MNNLRNSILRRLGTFGIDLVKTKRNIFGVSWYYSDLRLLKKQNSENNEFIFGDNFMILDEKDVDSGTMSGHYFHQDLHIAKRIFDTKPAEHLDIGSRVDGFVAHVACFRPIMVMDIRPLISKVENITFKQADLMKLPEDMIASYGSISSLHAIEHFGLGRYGDPIDIDGHVKAINNIHKMLKPDGTFYFSVPIGIQRIEFNAHRIFSVKYLLRLLKDKFEVKEFSFVNDHGDFTRSASLSEKSIERDYNFNFGCGIFELKKLN